MAYEMVVAAVVTAIVVTGLCFAVGWRKVYIVAPAQFFAALLVTCVMGPLTVREIYADDAFFLALIVSTLMPCLFVVLRVAIGILEKPDAAGVAAHARQRANQRDY